MPNNVYKKNLLLEDKDYVFLCDITYPRSLHAHLYAVKIVDNKYNVSIKNNVDKFNLTFIGFVFLFF